MNKCILSSFLMLGCSLASAGQPLNNLFSYVASVSAGPVWTTDAGQTQTIFLTPEIEKTYTANNSTNTLGDVELFLGIQRIFTPIFQGQLGLALGVTGDTTLSGDIWDDGDPEFDNFVYGYKLQHTHLALKGKLLMDRGCVVTPWISSSIGFGFNRAKDFHSMPSIFEALPTPDFSTHTQTSFTYTLGAGVQKSLNEHVQVGVGYEFADWGSSGLGRALGQNINSSIALNHFYTNGLLVNLTFVG